ncbi:argininosuccinate lyase [archaeon]|nr:argininosuccinate lyase [archaeon]
MIRKGRLGSAFDADGASFTSSLDFDKNIASYDVLGDMAHAIMLYESKIITKTEAGKILKGLLKIYENVDSIRAGPQSEDIHMAIEDKLTKSIGSVGGKLHTARSRNDQVALDLRMWARDEIIEVSGALIALEKTLLSLSKKHTDTIMPGYTHMQRAQPTTLAHHLLSYVEAFMRDLERLSGAYARVNLSPLGACAFAGTSFPIDTKKTAALLGFDGAMENSMDAVSSRDFITETLSVLAITEANVSRLASELILWSTTEFGFIEIADEFASTSSIMPQKKNPDVLEIMRARSALAYGKLSVGLSMVRGLPNSYNRDFQELSPLLHDSLEITKQSLSLLEKIVKTMKVDKKRMEEACSEGFITATELADLLVKEKGMPFRDAHQLVGAAVKQAIKENKTSSEIDSKFLSKINGWPKGISDAKIKETLSPQSAVNSKNSPGGPAPAQTKKNIAAKARALSQKEKEIRSRAAKVKNSKSNLTRRAKRLGGG